MLFLDPIENHKERCLFIKSFGQKLGFPWFTVATALYCYQKYFDLHPTLSENDESNGSSEKFGMLDLCICCLHFAGKLEETVERMRDFVNVLQEMFPELAKDVTLATLKPQILHIEQELLLALEFDFQIKHPHAYLLKLLNLFNASYECGVLAWELVNGCYATRVCIKYSMSTIAISCLRLSCRFNRFNLPAIIEDKPISEVLLSSDRWVKNCMLDLLDMLSSGKKFGLSDSQIKRVRSEVESNELGASSQSQHILDKDRSLSGYSRDRKDARSLISPRHSRQSSSRHAGSNDRLAVTSRHKREERDVFKPDRGSVRPLESQQLSEPISRASSVATKQKRERDSSKSRSPVWCKNQTPALETCSERERSSSRHSGSLEAGSKQPRDGAVPDRRYRDYDVSAGFSKDSRPQVLLKRSSGDDLQGRKRKLSDTFADLRARDRDQAHVRDRGRTQDSRSAPFNDRRSVYYEKNVASSDGKLSKRLGDSYESKFNGKKDEDRSLRGKKSQDSLGLSRSVFAYKRDSYASSRSSEYDGSRDRRREDRSGRR